MLRYALKRIVMMIPLLVGITAISFAMMHLAPGDPLAAMVQLDPRIDPEKLAELRHQYGLDQPIWKQYLDWLWRIAHLDFGESFAADHRPVWD
ncbi:MAG: ABC transporter permease, partial [Zetaproteobacteria bacterium]